MSEQEKQALTPEEFIARKGDGSAGGRESPCGEAGTTAAMRTAHDVRSSAHGSRSALGVPHTTAETTPHA